MYIRDMLHHICCITEKCTVIHSRMQHANNNQTHTHTQTPTHKERHKGRGRKKEKEKRERACTNTHARTHIYTNMPTHTHTVVLCISVHTRTPRSFWSWYARHRETLWHLFRPQTSGPASKWENIRERLGQLAYSVNESCSIHKGVISHMNCVASRVEMT